MAKQIDPNSYEAILARASRKLTPVLWDKIVHLLSRIYEDTNSPLNRDATEILIELGYLYSPSGWDKMIRDATDNL